MMGVISRRSCMRLPDILQIVPYRRFRLAANGAAHYDAPGCFRCTLQAFRAALIASNEEPS